MTIKTKYFRFLLIFVSLSIFILSTVNLALACECRPIPPCLSYAKSEKVFVGKLIKIVDDENTNFNGVNAYFEVERTFKGTTDKIEIVKFMIGSCDRDLTEGERYFVYKEPRYNNGCNMTNTLFKSKDDFDYASGLSQSDPIYTIRGVIGGLSEEELRNASVLIEDEQNRSENLLGKYGIYTFSTKRSGKYKVRIILPFQAEVFSRDEEVSVKESQTWVEYFLNFKPNECDYREISVQKIQIK